MSVVVWDIETQGLIKHSPGFDREEQVRNLEVSCLSYVVIPSAPLLAGGDEAAAAVEAAPMATLWRDEDEGGVGPFRALFEAFDAAELIVGYNSLGFDHPVLYKHCDRRRTEKHLFKVHDAFARLRDHTGVWFKLDHLLQANGLATKTADGLQAIEWWKEGERTLLREYCEQACLSARRLHTRFVYCIALHHRTCARSRGCSCCASSSCRRSTPRRPTTSLASRARWPRGARRRRAAKPRPRSAPRSSKRSRGPSPTPRARRDFRRARRS